MHSCRATVGAFLLPPKVLLHVRHCQISSHPYVVPEESIPAATASLLSNLSNTQESPPPPPPAGVLARIDKPLYTRTYVGTYYMITSYWAYCTCVVKPNGRASFCSSSNDRPSAPLSPTFGFRERDGRLCCTVMSVLWYADVRQHGMLGETRTLLLLVGGTRLVGQLSAVTNCKERAAISLLSSTKCVPYVYASCLLCVGGPRLPFPPYWTKTLPGSHHSVKTGRGARVVTKGTFEVATKRASTIQLAVNCINAAEPGREAESQRLGENFCTDFFFC